MKRLLVSLPEDLHEALRQIAFRRRSTMSRLVQTALEQTYEDELDALEAERGLEEFARDPSSGVSWEEFKASVKRAVQA